LIAHVAEREVELAGGVLLNTRGDADAAGFGEAFQARGDIDPVAEDVAILDDDVALVNPYAEVDAALRRERGVSLRHLRLNFADAAQRIDSAGEPGQQPVAGGLDDAAVIGGDRRINQLSADRPEPLQRALLISANQPRVSRHIRGKDRGETADRGHFRQIVK